MNAIRIAPLLVLLCLTGFRCAQPIGGNGSETTNGIIGTAFMSDGSPAAGARVRLRRSDFLATSGLGKTAYSHGDYQTDPDGRFVIDSLETGSYCIEISDDGANGLLISCTVSDSTLILPPDTLKPTGAITGSLYTTESALISSVEIYGLDKSVSVDAGADSFVIAGVPQGVYRIHATPRSPTVAPVIVDRVTVAAGETTPVAVITRNSLTITLNTSASGADVTEEILDFPLLVRLSTANFPFATAKPRGSDIRFVKSDGSPLPHEIERFDANAGRAEIWVKLDTVHGDDSTQSIIMSWGDSTVSAPSNGPAVFDTAAGFELVFHMAQPGGKRAFDATGNHFDGKPQNMGDGTDVPGAIGFAQRFNGVDAAIRLPNTAFGKLEFSPESDFTVSAWAFLKANEGPAAIVSKGNYDYSLDLNPKGHWRFRTYVKGDASHELVQDTLTPELRSWYHIVGVRTGGDMLLYVNGEPSANSRHTVHGVVPGDTVNPVFVGRNSSGYTNYLDGKIDEVRLSSMARSAGWIRLSYMNQKTPDPLIRFH